MSPVVAKGSPACIKRGNISAEDLAESKPGIEVFGGSMLKGEVCCGT